MKESRHCPAVGQPPGLRSLSWQRLSSLSHGAPLSLSLCVYTLVAMAAAGPRGVATKGLGGHEVAHILLGFRPHLVGEIHYDPFPWKSSLHG